MKVYLQTILGEQLTTAGAPIWGYTKKIMAPKKGAPEPINKSNKFRLVVFEGDFSDGSVSEIAQALNQALRPSIPPMVRQLPNGKPQTQLLSPAAEEEIHTEEQDQGVIGHADEEGGETPAASPSRPVRLPAKPRKHRQPELVDLDWNGTGGPTFKEFAAQKAPKSKARKYLVAALWLKEYGGTLTVNADRAYSAFRAAGWSVAFSDWDQPFRNLVFSDQMRKGQTAGEYLITTVGQGALEEAEK